MMYSKKKVLKLGIDIQKWIEGNKEQFIKMNLFDFIKPLNLKQTRKALTDLQKTNSFKIEVNIRKKNGEEIYGELSANLIDLGGNKIIQGIIRDITTRKLMEDVQAKRIKDLLFLSNSAMHFVGHTYKKDIYEYIGEQIQDLAGDAYVITASYNENTGEFNLKSLYLGE